MPAIMTAVVLKSLQKLTPAPWRAREARQALASTPTVFFVGRWEPLTQSDATADLTFKVRYTGPFLGTPNAILDSEEFPICDIAGASSHIDICQPIVDNCPSDPNKTEPGLCDCGRVDVDDNNNGICDLDESTPDPTSPTQDTDSDGWMNATETLCGSDYLVTTSVPDDHDDDNICDVQDPDDDNDNWSDTAEISCGTSPYNSSDAPTDADEDGICDERDDDISTLGDDSDGDGVVDGEDNCVDDANADQADSDGDGIGDVCDTDTPAPPSNRNAQYGGGNCSLNPDATAKTVWPLILILTCFSIPIILNLRTRKRR